ncbi:HEPN domain-containing protein [Moritella sp. Urea-trap-13]|uniref:HEPN domain-containing protein n=1 Tax=Moritella sp. Urea-trap-13 TaxID=2058327 RepID=UPI000C322893|nr:HEPN domain-containing protein [Moritella sp. Urea-trap-13]PKH06692.1 hypothetical protein CXF93_12405 [Moritella sp. Urea-trap-13]
MSSTTDYIIDLQEERARKWIVKQLGDESISDNSLEWKEVEADYWYMIEQNQEDAEWEAETEWLLKSGTSHLHKHFIKQLDALMEMAELNLTEQNKMPFLLNSHLVINMTYAYSVTLLEAFLGDTIKALINENSKVLKNAISNVEQLKKAKYSLNDFFSESVSVASLATRKISEEILFHNIPKVMTVYEQAIGKKLNIDFSSVNQITNIRHDIVHRNGYKIDGSSIFISPDDLKKAIESIKVFANDLQVEVNNKLSL